MKKTLLLFVLFLITSAIQATESYAWQAPDSVAESASVKVAKQVSDSMMFTEALAAAREEVGVGGLFKWRGIYFTTFRDDEWKALSAEEQSRYRSLMEMAALNEAVPVAKTASDNANFMEAFTAARNEVGAGGLFEWKGLFFTTYRDDEWNSLPAEKQQVYNDFIERMSEPRNIKVARNVDDSMSYNDAFNAARTEVGMGGMFKWHGLLFTTYRDDEWNNLSEQKKQSYNKIVNDFNSRPVRHHHHFNEYQDEEYAEDNTEEEGQYEEEQYAEAAKISESDEKGEVYLDEEAGAVWEGNDEFITSKPINDETDDSQNVFISDSDFDDNETTNEVSTLLQSSKDVFNNIAAYNFGSLRYRVRGYDNRYQEVLINGIEMNETEGGRPVFSNWGGLNDAMRNSTTVSNVGATEAGFGNIGGITDISTRASNYRAQSSFSYALSNRSYNNRLMATVGTGMMDNGWAFAVSASKRWSQQGYVEGTWYDAYSYFFSAEKRLNDKHSLGFTVIGAPSSRAGSSPTTQEVYDLVGTHYYNPNWGYQTSGVTGEQQMRNARVSTYHQPIFQLMHYWKPTSKTTVNTSAYYWFGRGGQTSLDWNEANDPRPDYYRNLPSYLQHNDLDDYEAAIANWTNNNTAVTQIDWDKFYYANSKHLQTITDATFNGVQHQLIKGNFSKYILEERRTDKNQGGFNTSVAHEINPRLHVNGGLNMRISRTHYYKTIYDLLGGDYYLDIDKYADQESMVTTDECQNDLNNPNHVVTTGDVFGYNYIANINKFNAWAQARYKMSRMEVYMGGQATFTEFWRTGLFKNGRFANDSYGDSPKNDFLTAGIKAGANYGFDGRNYITANIYYGSQAPQFRDAYIAPRVRNTLISNLGTEKVFTVDLNYEYRSPILKARVSAYSTNINNLIWNRSYYHEDQRTYVNYVMNGINELSQGIEMGAEWNVSPTYTVQMAAAKGRNIYTNRPTVSIYEDNDATPIAEGRTVYIKNYNVGETPQTVGSLGLKYSSPKSWWTTLNANFFADYYISVNPDKYTEESMNHFYANDYRVDQVLAQKKLDNAFTLDFFAGKTWNKKGYYIALNCSINNLLNNKNIVMYAYEQLRVDYSDLDKFDDKCSYLYGLNYFISLTIRK